MAVQTVPAAAPFECVLHKYGAVADGPHVEELTGGYVIEHAASENAERMLEAVPATIHSTEFASIGHQRQQPSCGEAARGLLLGDLDGAHGINHLLSHVQTLWPRGHFFFFALGGIGFFADAAWAFSCLHRLVSPWSEQ
jgi:hypothetical protein